MSIQVNQVGISKNGCKFIVKELLPDNKILIQQSTWSFFGPPINFTLNVDLNLAFNQTCVVTIENINE